MKIVILDAQGGGMGRQLVEGLKKALPNQPLIAVGTNALATAAMLRAGADQVATGENAVVVCAGMADLILCPIGMVLCDVDGRGCRQGGGRNRGAGFGGFHLKRN